jgi:hypothetical protein
MKNTHCRVHNDHSRVRSNYHNPDDNPQWYLGKIMIIITQMDALDCDPMGRNRWVARWPPSGDFQEWLWERLVLRTYEDQTMCWLFGRPMCGVALNFGRTSFVEVPKTQMLCTQCTQCQLGLFSRRKCPAVSEQWPPFSTELFTWVCNLSH